MTDFHLTTPTPDSNWRSIILFGRNVASYKFALAKALLDLADEQKTQLTLAELAPAFSQNICQHLRISDKQATSRSSRFLDSCRNFNKQEISEDQLVQETIRNGFNNVIDAFHIVNQGEVGFRSPRTWPRTSPRASSTWTPKAVRFVVMVAIPLP